MQLLDGNTQIPAGKIAAIATVLERRMDAPLPEAGIDARAGWTIRRVEAPRLDDYLDLYRRIGASHLWYGRLTQTEAEVAAYLAAETTAIFTLEVDGAAEGIMDLDFSAPGVCELVYFGVTPGLTGSGAARFMMAHVLSFVGQSGTDKLWLHTNTIDHPRAMAFYRRSGFVPVSQHLELADDPRRTGLYPRESAPQVPLFATSRPDRDRD
ncbi:GNAT family N-acetyltransferase [Fulvimarina sp. 2208YS6-2-32]|uniref:GNAT family N-acetyltransferase n=1 Tax=Fulvimarina uroteuthidis TaxID=3098149 RepID=A0ABU5HZ20_9HYPH|nr:GNAT family N-acetyltransferase [Fulvimarina sp. 2208YS6-2-32]MDY8108373.1 GNAT family N-acetyltransferase [Fulvimarina sp. 2208YS6-2-32]